jgi:hypothetical protein
MRFAFARRGVSLAFALALACAYAARTRAEDAPRAPSPAPSSTRVARERASAPEPAPPHDVTAVPAGASFDAAQSAEALPAVRNPPRVLSFTVSGGVSLGAFEAGVLYFLTEATKRSHGDAELRIATGASAGSANALISIMDSCSPPVSDPTQGLGFQTWMPVGISQLFRSKDVTATSILRRVPLQRAMNDVAKRWRAGLRGDCDVVLGVSVTRKVPQYAVLTKQDLGPAVQVPRSEERFVVRIRGRGPGRVPLLSNYVDPDAILSQPILPLSAADDDASQTRNFDRLLDLLYASASFPLAFAPYPLPHCQTDPAAVRRSGGREGMVCDHPDTDLFYDGGVFDNSPLRLNYREVERALRMGEDGRARWLDYDDPRAGHPPAVRYAYIDPAASAYPALDEVEKEKQPESALDTAFELATNFVETSRRRELLALLEETSQEIEFGEQMQLTQNQLPTISSQLGAFFGFFERDFRELDFYLGMYDGLVSVRRVLEGTTPSAAAEARLAGGFPVFSHPLPADLPAGWKPFACLLSQVEAKYADHAASCDGHELRNFRILLQVTLDRLHVACARTREEDLPPQASPLCFAAARGKPRMRVRGAPELAADRCKRIEAEQDFHFTLRLLSEYGFEYRDLGLSASEARYGETKIRRKLLSMADALARKQPTPLSEALIAAAGRAGANTITYEPPRNWLYLTAGTAAEVGASLLPFSWNQSWARLNLALQISHWETIATPKRFTMAITPLLGPEFQLLFLSGSVLQTMLGARVGYQAAWPDRAGLRGCGNERVTNDARLCSQLVLQGYIATALIERLRAQLVLEYFPTAQDAEFKSRIGFQLGFGLQLF